MERVRLASPEPFVSAGVLPSSEAGSRAGSSVRDARLARTAVLIVFGVGSLCRIVQFAWNPSLWHDEALVTMNLRERSYTQLLKPLAYEQAAPPLFLWAEKALLQTFGFSEYTLRIVSLLCGLAALGLFAWLALRMFPPNLALCAVALFALCDKLIWHSAEVKQYSCDVFAAVLLLALAVGDRRASALRRFIPLSFAGTVLVWLSFPSVFVFAALSIAVLCQRGAGTARHSASVAGSARPTWFVYVLGNLLVCASFIALYKLTVRGHAVYLDEYWQEHFLDWHRWWAGPIWATKEIYSLCDHPYRSFGWLVLPLAVSGFIHLIRTGRGMLAWAFTGPMLFCLLAACLHKYPFTGERITIFLVPGLFLLVVFGMEWLSEHWRWWALAPAPLLAAGIGLAGYHLVVPHARSGMRPIVRYLRSHRQPGDALYLVGEGAVPNHPSAKGRNLELLCYWPDADRTGPVHRTLPDVRAIPERRFWIVFAALPQHGTKLLDPLLREARSVATEVDHNVVPGGGAFLFENPSLPPQ